MVLHTYDVTEKPSTPNVKGCDVSLGDLVSELVGENDFRAGEQHSRRGTSEGVL